MLLREYLKEWTKEDLLNEARSYELKNCSRLKKDDLIDRIVEYLTTEEALRGYQRRTSLAVDGVCGCNTWKKITTAVIGVGRTKTTID